MFFCVIILDNMHMTLTFLYLSVIHITLKSNPTLNMIPLKFLEYHRGTKKKKRRRPLFRFIFYPTT